MAYQGFNPFIQTKSSVFILFQNNHGGSSIYTNETFVSMYDYLENSKALITLTLTSTLTPIHPSKQAPHVATANFLGPYPNFHIQHPKTSQDNATTVSWGTIVHQKLAMYHTIDSLTRQYCDACKWTVHLVETWCKQWPPFLPPQLWQKIQQYNLKHESSPKIPSNNPHSATLSNNPSIQLNGSNITLNQKRTTELLHYP